MTPSQPAKIHIERMMYRSSVSIAGESAASYALVKLIPGGAVGKPMALNLALVLDVSGSMYEEDGTGVSRLRRIQDAALSALDKLKPDDTLAIIAFAHNADIVLPATSVAERAKIEQVIQVIDQFQVDPGGTAMDAGIELGLAELAKRVGPGKLSQLVVLTDGETSGEQVCRELARKAAAQKIHFSVMGVGTEWNSGLIKDLAKLAEGKWYYIDVNEKSEAERIFVEEFEHLAAVGFTNVEMILKPFKDIKVKRVRQVVPEIKELPLTGGDGQPLVASLGTLEKDKPTRYILEMTLPKRPDGKYKLCQIEITYDLGSGKRETTGDVPLEIQYTLGQQGYVNAEVARHIDEVQIYELNKNLQSAMASNDQAATKEIAEKIEKKGEVMGPRASKKTMLARQVLQELNAGGRVSKKTQLAVDDAARLAAEETPA
jgi:Ca-activated chloride channel family protein